LNVSRFDQSWDNRLLTGLNYRLKRSIQKCSDQKVPGLDMSPENHGCHSYCDDRRQRLCDQQDSPSVEPIQERSAGYRHNDDRATSGERD
jgi:hypothetical protein